MLLYVRSSHLRRAGRYYENGAIWLKAFSYER
jgi:hypothetical protein